MYLDWPFRYTNQILEKINNNRNYKLNSKIYMLKIIGTDIFKSFDVNT